MDTADSAQENVFPDVAWSDGPDWEPGQVGTLAEYLQTVVHQLRLPTPLYQGEDYCEELNLQRTPFEQQRFTINALCKLFIRGGKAGFLMGETGTGKSLMGTAVIAVMATRHKQKMQRRPVGERRPFQAVIVAPPHLIDDQDTPVGSVQARRPKSQWREEIEQTLPVNLRYRIVQIQDIHTLIGYQRSLQEGRGAQDDLVIFLLTPSRLRGYTPFRSHALKVVYHCFSKTGQLNQLFRVADFTEPRLVDRIDARSGQPYWPAARINLQTTIRQLLMRERHRELLTLAQASPAAFLSLLTGEIEERFAAACHALRQQIDTASTDETAEGWLRLWQARLVMVRSRRQVKEHFCCPLCGQVLRARGADELVKADYAWLSKTFRYHDLCPGRWVGPQLGEEVIEGHYRTPLWSYTHRGHTASGSVRWPVGSWLYRNARDFEVDLALIDEAHLFKADTSAQGHGFRLIASKATHTLAMTGTPTGGYASTIFTLLHTLSPRFRRDYHFGEATRFSQSYGVWERTIKIDHGNNHNKASKGNTRNISLKERPGISALVLKDYLLEIGVPLLLLDIADLTMPPLEQYKHIIAMEGEQYQRVTDFTDQIRQAFRQFRLCAGKIAAAALQTQLVCPDLPMHDYDIDISISDPEGEKEVIRVAHFAALAGYEDEAGTCLKLLPKEQAVLELLAHQKAKRRKVMIYCCHCGKYDYIARLLAASDYFNAQSGQQLRIAGFYTAGDSSKHAWSGSGAPSTNRQFIQFADAKSRKGKLLSVLPHTDAVVINARSVETGLNLREFPTLVYLEMPYSVSTFRQSAARSWRPGQTQRVEVHVFVAADTLQMAALTLVAAKLAQDNRIRGELNMGTIEECAMGDDLYYQLSKVIRGELSVGQLGQSGQFKVWQQQEAEAQQIETGTSQARSTWRIEQVRIKRRGKPVEFVLQGSLF